MNLPATAPKNEPTLGILAGRGRFPTALCASLDKKRIPYVVAGLLGQTEKERFPRAEAFETVGVGALVRTAGFFSRHGARDIFFAGGIARKNVWRYLRPDRLGLSLIRDALQSGDNRLLSRAADAFSSLSINVLDPASHIFDMFIETGHKAGPVAAAQAVSDLLLAQRIALEHGSKDKGQAVIVRGGRVLGLEDRRGTDALILKHGGKGAVLVKMVKPGQDRRFDLPAVGMDTISAVKKVGISAVGVEAFGVLVLEKDDVTHACNAGGISLYGLSAAEQTEAVCFTTHGNAPSRYR